MDEFIERKWFVYLGDRHEGPFSLEEVSGQVSRGAITQQTYVWAEGMPDWKPMTEIEDFRSTIAATGKESPRFGAQLPEGFGDEKSLGFEDSLKHSDKMETGINLTRGHSEEPKRTSIGLILIGICVGFGLLGIFSFKSSIFQDTSAAIQELTRPHLLSLSEYFPKLQEWFSPIPAIDQMDPNDYAELKTAARGKIEAGPKFGMVAFQKELSPIFYVSSNLPDNTAFKIYAVGTPSTLLNHLSFSNSVETKLNQKLGQALPLRFPDGKPIPKGEYTVYLVAGENQTTEVKSVLASVPSIIQQLPEELPKTAQVLIVKKYFLGGKDDTTYQSRLKDYHDKLRARATAEITDIKQFLVTLENQLEASSSKYESLRKDHVTSKKRQEWKIFHDQWMKFESQLDDIFLKWTPEVVKDQYFYGSLFTLTSQAGQAIERLHGFQHSLFMDDHTDLNVLNTQVAEASSATTTVLKTLRAKVEQAEKLAPTANGMPQRQGI